MEEKIQYIRELERSIGHGVKNVNSIVEIRKIAEESMNHKDLRIAAMHSLRRIFIDYSENEKLTKPNTSVNKAMEKFYSWFISQYQEYLGLLCTLVRDDEKEWAHEVSIRTLLELVKVDRHLFTEDLKPKYLASGSEFGIRTFRLLLDSLISSGHEIDVDILLMLKDEYFIYNDCTYYTLLHLKSLISQLKEEFQESQKHSRLSTSEVLDINALTVLESRKKNLMDFMRILAVPLDVTGDEKFYILPNQVSSEFSNDSDDNSVSSDSDDGVENEGQHLDTGAKKRKSGSADHVVKKRSRNTTEAERLRSLTAYQKLFSKAWLSLLSLPFSITDHKLLLKHLPDNVVSYMVNPLLLSDYLTQSYNCGGVVAVLALESMFHLITKYNLDYPNFFASLYKLCKVEIFNAKYGGKFMKLLSASLKSTNLPAYLVAAFIKRLAYLSLHASSARAAFCVAQISWLLRQHRTCQVLVQRVKMGDSVSKDNQFNNEEEDDIEKCGALQSSLWELELLEKHHVYEVALLAKALRDPESTSVGAFPINVEQHIFQNYSEIFEADLSKPKGMKSAELAFRRPNNLFSPSNLATTMFG